MVSESTEGAFLERLPDSLGVVEVSPRLRQEKDVLVGPGRPVADRLGYRVALRPDAFRPESPVPSAQFEGNLPGDSREILRLEVAVARRGPSSPAPTSSL